MADKNGRNPRNAAGPWYVDSACIGCALCAGAAPEVFAMDEDGSAAYVARQPASPAEFEAAAQALSDCPAAAIGNDG